MRIADNKMHSARSACLARLSLAAPFLIATFAMLWAASLVQQPLWVDELHTGWVIADNWRDLPERAAFGNQSSDYFWLVKAFSWIATEQSAWVMRAPSILAWSVTISTVAWVLLRQLGASGAFIAGTCCLAIILDPMQCFYAVEARVYATVQCLNLWSWILVSTLVGFRLANNSSAGNQTLNGLESPTTFPARWKWWLWTALAVVMIRLHITSGLSAMLQGVVLMINLVLERRNAIGQLQDRADATLFMQRSTAKGYRWNAWLCLLVVLTSSLWILLDHRNIWIRRKLWQSFAGDGSLQALVALLPWTIFLVPITCLALYHLLGLIAKQRPMQWNHQRRQNLLLLILWTVAAVGPYGLAWLVTRCQIAPIFHYRFIITSAIPLYIAGGLALQWLAEHKSWHRSVAAVLLLGTQLYWQGIIDFSSGRPQFHTRWRNQRSEDWSQAVSWLNQNATPAPSLVFCYAGLVEGVGPRLPLEPSMDEYLSYPLRGPYRPSAGEATRRPHGLTADRSCWHKQILAHAENENISAVWIVYRGVADRLEQDLITAGLGELQTIHPVQQFGKVSVICLSWEQ